MKFCFLFVCVVAIFWVEVNANCSSLENPELKNVVAEDSVFHIDLHCTKYTCKNGRYLREPCSFPKCEGNAIPTIDFSKRYPDCCPVCPGHR